MNNVRLRTVEPVRGRRGEKKVLFWHDVPTLSRRGALPGLFTTVGIGDLNIKSGCCPTGVVVWRNGSLAPSDRCARSTVVSRTRASAREQQHYSIGGGDNNTNGVRRQRTPAVAE